MSAALWPPRQHDEHPYPPHWTELALCAEVDNALFFPEKGGSTREAKRVCRSCEVRPECLEYALETDQRFGIWGGLSERERRRLKRQPAASLEAGITVTDADWDAMQAEASRRRSEAGRLGAAAARSRQAARELEASTIPQPSEVAA